MRTLGFHLVMCVSTISLFRHLTEIFFSGNDDISKTVSLKIEGLHWLWLWNCSLDWWLHGWGWFRNSRGAQNFELKKLVKSKPSWYRPCKSSLLQKPSPPSASWSNPTKTKSLSVGVFQQRSRKFCSNSIKASSGRCVDLFEVSVCNVRSGVCYRNVVEDGEGVASTTFEGKATSRAIILLFVCFRSGPAKYDKTKFDRLFVVSTINFLGPGRTSRAINWSTKYAPFNLQVFSSLFEVSVYSQNHTRDFGSTSSIFYFGLPPSTTSTTLPPSTTSEGCCKTQS